MIDISKINSLNQSDFISLFGHIFENSDWVAEQAWNKRPFSSIENLHQVMFDIVNATTCEAKISFLCAHPELAGKEALEGAMTNASAAEQGTAGLDRLEPEELKQISFLNDLYRSKHGFPFIIAVRHYTKLGIFAELRSRLKHDTAIELDEALRQIRSITWYRLDGFCKDKAPKLMRMQEAS
ncbi:2-oxo-4-hydroxy-4-carboxy-5-ureidoimidazoline decarboxylase [Brucella cytisi]|uniref:2-oxo-4-hydroxy-4-carboxy-5-ureidoimidazoline decarboxylase n=1 Tax=Brucella cytisi TaxID=407152 RepID=A0A1J6I4V0_9HYPH|nr:2-oxo-4-hydroxy-4-carboxy-5-ureidoimidazoline decarboxylase [Brucella cytisi]OIS92846.1 OHCU decarboxylase [Brucella cytisi]